MVVVVVDWWWKRDFSTPPRSIPPLWLEHQRQKASRRRIVSTYGAGAIAENPLRLPGVLFNCIIDSRSVYAVP